MIGGSFEALRTYLHSPPSDGLMRIKLNLDLQSNVDLVKMV